ncbi:NADH dehydrogenase I chain L [Salmonella sp. NCTC 11881]|nr:NADH dehydrogenase I chain L [Salmonella sp. NCTC 11881]
MANGHINLMVAGLVGAFMTSLYTFRMIFIVFHGKEQIHAHAGKGITHHLPLIVLMILSTFVGALIVPPLQGVLPQTTELAHGRVMTAGNYLWRSGDCRHSDCRMAVAG